MLLLQKMFYIKGYPHTGIHAAIDESNYKSLGLFREMGFAFISKEDELMLYEYKIKKIYS